MKKETRYWVDENNNKWSVFFETEDSALLKSVTLINCNNCNNCNNCRNYNENPQRIISQKIGSRSSQTTIYWNDSTNIQVICGCFRGNLEQFKEKVKQVHGNNKYAREYFNFIEKVKQFIE
jgi:hypothetical protein